MEDTTINKNKNYKEINQNDFVSEVIEESKNSLIIVDFWAPWCGPCKELGPRIEKIVGQTNGKAKLIKINIDENQELASQLQIQSIPTVYAFKDGKIANAFQGSVPESKIIKFIEDSLGEKIEGNITQQLAEARALLNKKQYNESINLLEELLGSKERNNEIIELLIKNYVALNKLEDAEEIINSLSEEMHKDKFVESALSYYNLTKNAGASKSDIEILEIIKKDPLNIKNNKKLSDLYFGNHEYDKAFTLLTDLFSKSKKEQKDEIKQILFDYFKLLGDNHESTKEGRRKLSSKIFS